MELGNADFVPVILGTNLNTYNIARSLHVAYGVRTLALGRAALRETAHSAIVEVRTFPDFDDPESIVARLLDVAAEFPGRKRLLIANIEFYTGVVLDHRAELDEHFLIPLVDAKIGRQLMSKTGFAHLCAEYGIAHPTTVVIAREALADEALGEDLPFPYPVILKPSDTDVYGRMSFPGKKKVYLVADARELRASVRAIYDAGYGDELLIQQNLAGGEAVTRAVNTYSDQHGRLKFLSAAQIVLAEHDPLLVGNHNAMVTMHDEELTETIRRLLDGIGYVGAANIDVMIDRATGTSTLLEVNLRQGATSFYTMAAGGNLARCYVEDLVLGKELPLQVTTEQRLWINMPYWMVRRMVPAGLQPLVQSARRHGLTHTLRYRKDRSVARLLTVARIDLRYVISYLRNPGSIQ